jgi:hypothetical protein
MIACGLVWLLWGRCVGDTHGFIYSYNFGFIGSVLCIYNKLIYTMLDLAAVVNHNDKSRLIIDC